MFPSNPPTGIQRRPQHCKWGRAQSHPWTKRRLAPSPNHVVAFSVWQFASFRSASPPLLSRPSTKLKRGIANS